jgi:LuxR family maltose regulon positive regulatory protein
METVRDFLLFTSPLTRLNGDLCDELLRLSPAGLQAPGRGQVTLEHLVKNRLLTTCSDAKGEWYSYHPCFARMLQDRLSRQSPGLLARLHQRASEWLESKGDLESAFQHALAYGDEARAVQVIETHVLAFIGGGQINTILTWLGQLSAGMVLQNPWLCLAEAWATAYEGWKMGVDTLLSNVETAAYALPAALAQRARGHVAAIRLQLLREAWDSARCEELARLALELLPIEDHAIRCFIATLLGIELRQRNRLEAASEALTEAIASAAQSRNRAAAITPYCRLADLYMVEGRMQKVLVLSEEALGIAQKYQVESGHPLLPAGLAHIYAGMVLYERDDLDAAQGHVLNGINLCTAWGNMDAASLGQVLLATTLNARGNLEKAREAAADAEFLLEKAQQDLASQSALQPAESREKNIDLTPIQQYRAEARLIRLYLKWGELEIAKNWLEKNGYGADDRFELPQAIIYITVAKVLLAQGRLLEARRLSRRLSMICENAGANYILILALVLQTQLMNVTNDFNGALTVLRRALQLAEPEKVVRPFIDVLFDLNLLLKRLSEGGPGAIYARAVLGMLDRQAYRSEAITDLSSLLIKPQTRPLQIQEQNEEITFSNREIEVLRLLASYLSVLEIASYLEISTRTADTIVRNICRKLGVREPSQAVENARSMKLI